MPFAAEADFTTACERLLAANIELEGLTALTTGDDVREWSTDEQAQAEALDAECEGLEAQVYDHKTKRDAAKKLRTRALARAERLDSTSRGRQTTPGPLDTPDSLETPAAGTDGAELLTPEQRRQVRRSGKLLAYSGPDAQFNAYASGQWLMSLFGEGEARANAHAWCKEHLAMSGTSMGKGGALIPDAFDTAIIDLRDRYGVARREMKTKQMPGDTLVTPRRVSGPTAYFIGENEEITESDKDWDDVELTARKIGALSKFSSELDEDSIIGIADDLAYEFAYAFAKKEDQCAFIGDASTTYGKISGLITQCTAATATIVTALTGNIAFSSLDMVDFISMIGKLPDYAEDNAKWFISKAGFAASMMSLVMAAGGNTAEMLAGKVRRYFMGYEVVLTSVMNSTLTDQTSTKGLCYLGDLRLAATLGNRRGIRIKASEHRYIEKDQIVVTGTQRFAMNVHDVGDTSVAGAMIMLATPGS